MRRGKIAFYSHLWEKHRLGGGGASSRVAAVEDGGGLLLSHGAEHWAPGWLERGRYQRAGASGLTTPCRGKAVGKAGTAVPLQPAQTPRLPGGAAPRSALFRWCRRETRVGAKAQAKPVARCRQHGRMERQSRLPRPLAGAQPRRQPAPHARPGAVVLLVTGRSRRESSLVRHTAAAAARLDDYVRASETAIVSSITADIAALRRAYEGCWFFSCPPPH